MGGSGGGSYLPSSHEQTSNSRTSSTNSSSGQGQQELRCPEILTDYLNDVARADQTEVSQIKVGDIVTLVTDGNRLRVEVNDNSIGWLPAFLSGQIIPCLSKYSYNGIVRTFVSGSPPRIEVTVQRQ